jgi:hypothetical protein
MSPLLSLLFALRIGSFGSPATHQDISVREEVRAVTATVLRSNRTDTLAWSSAPGAPDWIPAVGLGPRPGFHVFRPDEWVALVVNTLHVESTPAAKVAMWIATRPVRVDITRDRIFMRVRIAGP